VNRSGARGIRARYLRPKKLFGFTLETSTPLIERRCAQTAVVAPTTAHFVLASRFASTIGSISQNTNNFKDLTGGADGTRTRDPRRDRPVFSSSSMNEGERASIISAIYLTLGYVRTCSVMAGH
jgi:hypothetical protein